MKRSSDSNGTTTELTRLTTSGGVLSKHIRINGAKIDSDGSACRMSHGKADRLSLDSAQALADVIPDMRRDQALALAAR